MKIFFDALSTVPTVSIGTQAYIISGLQIIEKKFPGSEYLMFSSHPEIEESYLGKLPYHITLIKREKGFFGTMVQFRKVVKQVDVIVSSWGDAYISSPPYMLFRKALFLKKRGVPLLLFTSSMGPFKGGIEDSIAKYGLSLFDYISVRDKITYDGLLRLGLMNIKLIHDTAFVLEPANSEEVNIILNDLGLNNFKYIGLNISVLLYHRFKIIEKNYIKDMIDIITWLKSNFKLPIILIPHQIFPAVYQSTKEQYQSVNGDDRYVIDLIWNEISDKSDIYRLMGNFSPMELKGIIKGSELFIGGRMHSVIAAVSTCTPSIIMQYSHKAGGMMEIFNMSDYVWDISESSDSLKLKLKDLWLNKKSVRDKLEKVTPKIFDNIYSLANEIKK